MIYGAISLINQSTNTLPAHSVFEQEHDGNLSDSKEPEPDKGHLFTFKPLQGFSV